MFPKPERSLVDFSGAEFPWTIYRERAITRLERRMRKTVLAKKVEAVVGPVIEIIHFADPFCWWSWGLEPILQRLREVYGDQIEVTYRMGGMANKISQWRKDYNVVDDKSLKSWIVESISLTGVPVDLEFISKGSAKSSWPACIAMKAAELQSKELAERYFRRLLERIQVEADNVSEDGVYLPMAKEVGLDVSRMKESISSGRATKLFEEDRKAMNVNFLTLVLVNKKNGESLAIGGEFSSEEYEKAVDELSGGLLTKKIPVDILEYFERHRHNRISAREIATVFKISEQDAEERLGVLTEGGLLKRGTRGVGTKFWTSAKDSRKVKKLTIEQLNVSHITDASKVDSGMDFEVVITKAVNGLYTQVALNPNKTYHFPLGRRAALFVGYPELELNQIPETAVESFAGVGFQH